jgi:uncharacterized OsmC-like protein
MVGMDSRGRTLVIGKDSDSSPEWIGLKPSDLLLIAAAACTAYDVVNVLKSSEANSWIACYLHRRQLPEPPYTFVGINLKYIIKARLMNIK